MAEMNEIYKIRYVTDDGANQVGFNVCWYIVTAKGGTGATDPQIATAADTAAAGPYKALIANGGRYRGAGAQQMLPIPPGNEFFSVAGAGPGTAGAEMLPRQTSGLISWRTDIGGRAYRGRSYISFPSETDNGATGVPTGGYVINLSTLAGAIRVLTAGGGGNTNVLTLGIFHRSTLLITPTNANTVLNVRWATQRRRGSFGQTNVPPF